MYTVSKPPRFSIVTPVYNTPLDVLRECLESVLAQTFTEWELCLVDDASPDAAVRTVLDEFARRDPRIRVRRRSKNGGIVAASNDGLEMATGEFVVLLDHDDLLTPDALAMVDAALLRDDQIDYVYSDEDKLSAKGEYYDEFRKPDWSPERFRAQNYLCHLSTIRSTLVRDVGGFRPGFDGSQDYDLLLRVTEQARRIHHVPEVLYHWRVIPGSAAGDPMAKPEAYTAGERALRDHFARVGIDAEVVATALPGHYRNVRRLHSEPLVSIIIPTRGTSRHVWGIETNLVVNAMMSVHERSTYRNFEFVVVADTATDPDVLAAIGRVGDRTPVVVPYSDVFNFSKKINLGAAAASGDVLLLLNDDTEVISPDWIETLLALVLEKDVGMVGPLLRFSDGTIQAAGHSHDQGVRNLGQTLPGDSIGQFGMLRVARECIGVTAACAAIRAEVFNEVGGLNMELPNSFNDVDFGLKLRHLGYRIIWTPFAELYHFESMTRDSAVRLEDYDLVVNRWGIDALTRDPYGPDPYRQMLYGDAIDPLISGRR